MSHPVIAKIEKISKMLIRLGEVKTEYRAKNKAANLLGFFNFETMIQMIQNDPSILEKKAHKTNCLYIRLKNVMPAKQPRKKNQKPKARKRA